MALALTEREKKLMAEEGFSENDILVIRRLRAKDKLDREDAEAREIERKAKESAEEEEEAVDDDFVPIK